MIDATSATKPLHLPSTAQPLPSTWKWVRLDDACVDVFDCPHSTPQLTLDGPYVVRSQDILSGTFRKEEAAHVSEDTYRERITRAEPIYSDLLYSREGTYFGIAAEVPQNTKVCLGQRMVLIRPNLKLLHFRFLKYWLNSGVLASHVYGQRDGTVAERLNLPTIRGLPIPVPPLATQENIAHILGTLDDKIELNRHMNDTLEALARAIFKSWFVDFDPGRAKMEGRQPLGMDTETAALFPDEFEDSALGPIPKGWKVVALPEAIEVNPRRTLSKGQVAPYLDMANMPTRGHRPDEWIDRAMGSGTKFMNGDTLLARITPCLENGKTAFVDFLDDEQIGWGSTEYIVFRPKPPLPVEFGYYLARSENLRTHAIQNMTGSSGRQRVPAECFDSYSVVVPKDEVAKRFGSLVKPLMQGITQRDEESRTLATLRDTLLPKLLSGEVRIEALSGYGNG